MNLPAVGQAYHVSLFYLYSLRLSALAVKKCIFSLPTCQSPKQAAPSHCYIPQQNPNMNFSTEDVVNALRNVLDPDIKKDLVTLNMISEVAVSGNKVSFKVTLTTPACPLKEKIKKDCMPPYNSI
jgi:hypothetical protein